MVYRPVGTTLTPYYILPECGGVTIVIDHTASVDNTEEIGIVASIPHDFSCFFWAHWNAIYLLHL